MFIKVRRDTLIILVLAFILILSGRFMTYTAYASSPGIDQGTPISGVIITGNDIEPTDVIKANIANEGFREGSYIEGDTLVTSKTRIPLSEAITNAEQAATQSAYPGTTMYPITAASITVNNQTGIVTVNVIEDWSSVVVK
jgi:hypothetical protein